MRLEHRVVFITGASRGIGRAIALACAREGADVVLTARAEVPGSPRPPSTIHNVAREVQSLGRKALRLQFDVRDDGACEAAVKRAEDELGRIDVLIHNAGALWWADITETSIRKFDAVMGVHVRAAFVLSRAVLPRMIARRYGHIVMMSPPVEPVDCGRNSIYAISKFGMTMIAQAIAEETSEHNVTAHALWPSVPIATHPTGHLSLGSEVLRTADIVADATLALLAREPHARKGRAWLDEDLLRAEGITDFSKYECVTAEEPPASAVSPDVVMASRK
jgi:citronellol/citronellal dehydrogenase